MVQRSSSASAGLLPVKGTWGQVRIGSKIQGSKGTLNDVWEVVDMRTPAQFDYKITPWFKVRNVADGTEVAVRPLPVTYAATFMVPEGEVDPEDEKPKLTEDQVLPHRRLSDQDAIDLLVNELGATKEAWWDKETGIVTCPPYEQMMVKGDELLHHLQFAHGMNMDAVDPKDTERIITIHGEAHANNARKPYVPGPGFPHKHAYLPPGRDPERPRGDFY